MALRKEQRGEGGALCGGVGGGLGGGKYVATEFCKTGYKKEKTANRVTVAGTSVLLVIPGTTRPAHMPREF